MEGLSILKRMIREVVLESMIDKTNSFSPDNYQALARLLLAIEDFPEVSKTTTVFCIRKEYDRFCEMMVVDINEERLILEMQGVVNTGMGSDSYEKGYMYLDRPETYFKYKEGEAIDLQNAHNWYRETMEFLEDGEVKYNIEQHDLPTNFS